MSNFTFEDPNPAAPLFNVEGEATFVDTGHNPTSIIRTTDPSRIEIELTTSGALEPFLFGDCEWVARAKFEGWGVDPEFVTPEVTLPITPGGPNTYNLTIDLPAGSVQQGTYLVVVVVSVRRAVPPHDPAPVIGFAEMRTVQYFTP